METNIDSFIDFLKQLQIIMDEIEEISPVFNNESQIRINENHQNKLQRLNRCLHLMFPKNPCRHNIFNWFSCSYTSNNSSFYQSDFNKFTRHWMEQTIPNQIQLYLEMFDISFSNEMIIRSIQTPDEAICAIRYSKLNQMIDEQKNAFKHGLESETFHEARTEFTANRNI
jgi:hypothetical protein